MRFLFYVIVKAWLFFSTNISIKRYRKEKGLEFIKI